MPAIARAQVVTWAHGFGDAAADRGNAITIDGSGNVLTAGAFSGTVDFDPAGGGTMLSGTTFIQKLDSNANLIWALSFNQAEVLALATDADKNIIATGRFSGTTDFDPGIGTYDLTAVGDEDIVVLKLDSTGAFLWAITIGGSEDDAGRAVTTDGAGNIYLTGSFRQTADFDPGAATFPLTSEGGNDIFVLKLAPDGSLIWAASMGAQGEEDMGNAIAIDAAGDVYITGSFRHTVDFDPGPGSSTLVSAAGKPSSLFLQKLNADGAFIRALSIDALTATALAVDLDNNLLLTGAFEDDVDFDPGQDTAELTALGGSDIFVLRLDSAGAFQWAVRMGGNTSDDLGLGIATDAEGNVYTTGIFRGNVDFNPGNGTNNLNAQGVDLFIQKLSPSGGYSWARRIGASGEDRATGIAISSTSNIFLTGSFNGTVDFDFGSGINNISAASSGDPDAFVLRIQPYGCNKPAQPGIISGPGGICHGTQAVFSIDPVPGATAYTWSLPGGGWIGAGTITDTFITATANGNNGNIIVTANNNCGSSAQRTKAVTVSLKGILVWQSGNMLYASPGYSLYTWYRDSVMLGTTTVNKYALTQTGVYHAFVTDNIGCDLYSNTDTAD